MRRAEQSALATYYLVALSYVAAVAFYEMSCPTHVVEGVVAYDMSVLTNLFEQLGIFANVVADDEECGFYAPRAKCLKDERCGFGDRTIVEDTPYVRFCSFSTGL